MKADPNVRFGKLENGIHYAILANHEPKQRASLRLLVLSGSAQETDAQQGLAHFVEHMAFNGSTHYPPGTLVEYFQRMGMNFGGDTNANTGFERTVYLLELPNTEAKTLEEGWRVFGDYARGELLKPEEISRERGIILSEKRDRDSVEYRRYIAQQDFLLHDTLIPKRLPIGTTQVISHAGPDQFRAYYDTWYRPERMAVVAVGDFDVAQVEAEIIAALSSIKPSSIPEPHNPSLGTIPKLDTDKVLYLHQPEAAETSISVTWITPYSKENDTGARRLAYLPRDLAFSMLNRRFSILSRQADAPFLQAGVGAGEAHDFFREATLDMAAKPENWAAALTVGEKELHRALEYGFTEAELKEAVANYRHDLEESVKTAPTRRSPGLADHLVESMLDDTVFTTPADELALYAPALDRITPQNCLDALRAAFPDIGRYISVAGNAKIEAPKTTADAKQKTPEDIILATYREASNARVEPPAKTDVGEFAYTNFGAPGTVTSRKHVDDLDVDLLTLSNGVRLNFKKTDFEANRVHVSVRLGTGLLTQPKDQAGLGVFATNAFVLGGLGKHTVDDLIRLLAGHTVGLNFQVGSDALEFSGSTNRDDLLLQLRLLTAFIVDPGYRPEALGTVRKNFETMYAKLEHVPEGPLQLKVVRQLASGDPRFGTPPKADLLARNFEEARAWLTPQLAHGAIEISVVGDLDPAATIDAVSQTFGALPQRAPKPALDEARKVSFPKKPFNEALTVDTEIPRGLVALIWPTNDARNVFELRRMRILADVFSDRLRVQVRQKLGDAYSPAADISASETYPGYGMFLAYVEVDPAKSKIISDAVLAIAADLATNGVTEEELARAKQPVLTTLRESARTNGYWLGSVLQSAQEFPQHLEWSRSRYHDTESISKADLDALAKKYLPTPRAFQVVITPTAAAKK
ncbi:MAG TPA: insulinase family protein [Opitutaceae bacterium]|nr:insulinase family protein [Opitutaceae bacterium]